MTSALSNLGNALSRLGEHEEAISCLRRVTELRPRDGAAWKNLGNALRRAGRPPEAVTAYRMATELSPRDADARNNLGAALQECGKVAEAERALSQCLSINPNHTDAHWNRGLALLALGRWREGWVEYEWRRHLREDLGQKRDFPQPIWQGSPLEGRHILVLCEQGLGDTIQFMRYVPMLVERGATVTVECQGKLKPLLSCLNSDAATRGHGDAGKEADKETRRPGDKETNESSRIRVISRGEALPDFDMHAQLMTLPCIFGSTPDDLPNDVPYLKVDESRTAAMRERLDRSSSPPPALVPSRPLLVGLTWQGNTAHKGDRFRSIPLEKFSPLAQIEGVQFVSLQKGHGCDQIEKNKDEINLLEWSDPNDLTAEALVDTAAMIQCLDLVIAVDTAVAHLAGALGVPVWMATPLAADWRWLSEREDTPWYPAMRLFRQAKLGQWEDVVQTMADELKDLAGGEKSLQRHALALA